MFNADEISKGAPGVEFTGVATRIESGRPILIERPLYVAGRDVLGPGIDDGTVVPGAIDR